MTRSLTFRLVNVFAEDSRWSGNALAVVEDGRDLSGEDMQAIALQFNLSETTFVLPSSAATAGVRIFTPAFEMPFAGHPTLGTAYVVSELRSVADAVTLEMKAGIIPVSREGDTWTFRARPPTSREPSSSHLDIAEMLGLGERDVLGPVLWVDTGSEQLVVPLASRDAVERCQPVPQLLLQRGSNAARDGLAYVWARQADGYVAARFFFMKHGAVVEDPGTGSACANLGGWHIATRAPLPKVSGGRLALELEPGLIGAPPALRALEGATCVRSPNARGRECASTKARISGLLVRMRGSNTAL